MPGTIFARTLRDQWRGLVGWGLGVASLVFAMSALWPSVRDMPDLEQFLSNYPKALRDLFDIQAITTGGGYLNAELFSIILPTLFVVYAIGCGARLVAGEEEDHTLEVLLTMPVSRTRILLEKTEALVASTTVLGMALLASTLVASQVFSMDIAVGQLAAAALAMTLLGTEHGLVALAVGAATGSRVLAIAAAGTLAAAGYVLYITGELRRRDEAVAGGVTLRPGAAGRADRRWAPLDVRRHACRRCHRARARHADVRPPGRGGLGEGAASTSSVGRRPGLDRPGQVQRPAEPSGPRAGAGLGQPLAVDLGGPRRCPRRRRRSDRRAAPGPPSPVGASSACRTPDRAGRGRSGSGARRRRVHQTRSVVGVVRREALDPVRCGRRRPRPVRRQGCPRP